MNSGKGPIGQDEHCTNYTLKILTSGMRLIINILKKTKKQKNKKTTTITKNNDHWEY